MAWFAAGGAGQTWDSVVQSWEVSEMCSSFAIVVADQWSFAYNPKEPPAIISSTKKMPITAQHATFLLNAFQDHTPAQERGFVVDGIKYFALDLNPRTLHFRKGSAGIVAVRCRGAMLVAQYTPPTAASSCLIYMDRLADVANEGIPGVHVGIPCGGGEDAAPTVLDSLLHLNKRFKSAPWNEHKAPESPANERDHPHLLKEA